MVTPIAILTKVPARGNCAAFSCSARAYPAVILIRDFLFQADFLGCHRFKFRLDERHLGIHYSVTAEMPANRPELSVRPVRVCHYNIGDGACASEPGHSALGTVGSDGPR
jgi:hypothetical protein